MSKTLLRLMTLMVLVSLTACEREASRERRAERADARYRTAMADYNAGHLDKSIGLFREILRDDPANASARFQLACLLQDSAHDYVGAYCAYYEYLQQQPKGDKTDVAHQRFDLCEREIAKSLAKKYGIDSTTTLASEVGGIRSALKGSQQRVEKLDSDLALAMRKIASLRAENARLLKMVKGDAELAAEEHVNPVSPSLKDAQAILDEDESTERVQYADELAALRKEGEAELADAQTTVVPPQPADAKAQRDAAEAAAKAQAQADAAAREPLHEKRPDFYVVQEGDTLIRIAMRFYGRPSAWAKIRQANKAIVSSDGRVQAGQRLVLPK